MHIECYIDNTLPVLPTVFW